MSSTDPKPTGATGNDGTSTPAGPLEPGTESGRHAVQRPAPTPPGPTGSDAPRSDAPDPVMAPTAAQDPATRGAGPGDAEPGADARTGGTGPATRPAAAPSSDDDELFPDPNAPRTPHGGTHLLGVLVGLLLAPLAIGVLLFGQSQILEVQVDGWDASLELLGIVLVSTGALMLAALVLLGLWTAAVPITAGLLLGLLGGLQLYAPGIARATTLEVIDADAWDLKVTQVTVAATSGTTIVAGVLLLAAGVTIALGRRHGVKLGAFRERNRAA